MAETLNEQQKFFKSVTTVKLKDRPIFKGSVDRLKGIGYDVANLVGMSKEHREIQLTSERARVMSGLQDELKSLALLEDLSWNSFSNSEKQMVLNLVKNIQELSGVNLGVDHMQDDAKVVLTKCMEVVEQVGEQVKGLASLGSFTHDNLKDLIAQMDKGSIDYYRQGAGVLIPSKDDLDIVTALKMTGIDLQFNDGKWELISASVENGQVSFVPTKDGKPLQVFGNENIQFLLNNYLNVPQGQRQQTVIPSKLLQVYINEYERQLMEGKDPSSLEGGLVKQEVARQRNIFSMDSNEFQITKLLDRDTMMRNAQRMAIVGTFVERSFEARNTGEIANSIETIIDSMSTDPAYKDVIKSLDKLVPMLEGMGDRYEDATQFDASYNEDYMAQYNRQIEYLQRTGASAEYIEALTQAKQEFIETINVQRVYWQAKLVDLAADNNGNIFSEGLAGAISESMGFAVMQNDGGEFVMANGETVQKFLEDRNLSVGLYNELKERAQKRAERTSVEQEQKQVSEEESKSVTEEVLERQKKVSETIVEEIKNNESDTVGITKYPEILLEYAAYVHNIDFSENNFVLDYSNLRLYQSMWQEGCFFDIDFAEFKKNHPEDATIDAYVKHFAEEKDVENPFDPELVKDAYVLVHPKEVEQAQVDKVQSKIDAFNKHLLMSDIMLATFTPDDLLKYETMPDSIKTTFLNQKYQEALKAYEELEKDPVGYKESLEKAKKRHEAGIVGSVIQHMWSEAAVADNGNPKGPLISSAVDAFLKACAKTQQKNNNDLIKDGEPIIDNGEPSAEHSDENDKVTKNETTYGKMFPSGPNVNKFLKLMKPYSAKAVTKYFIEPLMVDIDKAKIDLDAYYAKVDSVSDIDFTTDVAEKDDDKEKGQEDDKEKEEDKDKTETASIVKITQRDFEASSFMPASIMFEELAKNNEKYDVVRNISYVFNCLSSTDKDMIKGNTIDGKDYRDALREFAIKLCGKEIAPENNLKAAESVESILNTYGIRDDETIVKFKTAFLYVTPEVLAYAFDPCSKIEEGKMTIGAGLPVEQLLTCENDAQRRKVISEQCDMQSSMNLLNELVCENGIYRTQTGQMDVNAINQGYSRQGASIPQMAELMRLRDAMRAQGMNVPQEFEVQEEQEMGE